MHTCVSILICLLVTLSLMWPSEGAIHGDGLHLTLLWVVAALIAVWFCPAVHSGNTTRTAIRGGDGLAVLLLVVGFWISTWHVFQVHGDRRAAVNLSLEWTAIGVAWWLVSGMVSLTGFRQTLLRLMLSLGVGASVLGLAQHHVTYQRQADWYQQQRAALTAATENQGLEATREKNRIEAEFESMGIPQTGTARELFERRLLDSSEPVGPFALANSLGGLLAMLLVILFGGGPSEHS